MTDQERITALEARIAQLESRVAIAERGPVMFGPNPYQLPQAPRMPFPAWNPGDVWGGSVALSGEAAYSN